MMVRFFDNRGGDEGFGRASEIWAWYTCAMFRLRPLLIVVLVFASRAFAQEKGGRAVDAFGDPLPRGAVARLGTTRFWHPGTIGAIAFSPDGRTVASGGLHYLPVYDRVGGSGAGASKSLLFWNSKDGSLLREVEAPFSGFRFLAYSQDGKTIAAAFAGALCAWDAKSMNIVWQAKDLGEIRSMSFLADGTLAAGTDQKIHVWRLRDGKVLKGFSAPAPPMNTAEREWNYQASAISHDGRRIAWIYAGTKPAKPGFAFAHEPDQHYVLWDTVANRELWAFEEKHDTDRRCMADPIFSPDGRLLVGIQGIWDVERRARHCLFPKDHFVTVAFSPKGDVLAGSSGYQLSFIDVASGKLRGDPHPMPPLWRVPFYFFAGSPPWSRPMAFSSDGSLLATGHSPIRILDVRNETPGGRFAGCRDVINYLEFSRDGSTLFTGGPADEGIPSTESLTRWHRWQTTAAASEPVFSRRAPWSWAISLQHDLQFAPDEADEKRLRLQRLSTGEVLWSLAPTNHYWSGGAVSPNGRHILLSSEKKLHLFDVKTGKKHAEYAIPNEQQRDFQFSPDGRWLGWCAEGRVYVADVATGKVVHTFSRQSEDPPIPSFTFSRDSRFIAFMLGDDPILHVRALDNSKPARRLHPAPDRDVAAWYPCLAFSADRRTIAMSRKDEGEVDLVETLTGQVRLQLKGHQADVAALRLSPDGRYLVSGSADTTALVWDLKDPFGKKRADKLSATRLAACWSALAGSSAEDAYDAILDMIHAPGSSVPFLVQNLAAAAAIDPKRLAGLIMDLDSGQFAVRSKAMSELERYWDLCGDAIAARLKEGVSLEVRRRLESLRDKINGAPPPEGLRGLRALEVLEHLASPAARRLLQRLSEGNPAAHLTQQARETLERLDQRKSAPRQ